LSSKSKSHEKLYEDSKYELPRCSYNDVLNKHKIPLETSSKIGFLESSLVKNHCKPSEPVLQSKELYSTLIDSPCTKYQKMQFDNALSSASKYLLNRHLESIQNHADIFSVKTPETNLPLVNENNLNESKTPHLMDLSITPKQDTSNKFDFHTQTSDVPLLVENVEELQKISDIPLLVEDLEELKKSEIEEIRQSKLKCCDLIKIRFKEIELEIEKNFNIMENKVTDNYNKLLKKIQDGKDCSPQSQLSEITVETVKEKKYSRMTGGFGFLNNLNQDCSFLKTPKIKGKTREDMLKNSTLTPCTMSFVLQEQLMHLNSNS
jgi:hypothetical protein